LSVVNTVQTRANNACNFVYPLPPILARVPILLAPPPHSRPPVRAGSRPQLWAPIATGAQGRAGKVSPPCSPLPPPFSRADRTAASTGRRGDKPPSFRTHPAHSSSTRKRGACRRVCPLPPFLHPRPHTDARTGHANAGRRGTTRGQAPSRTRANPRANGGTCRRIYPLPPCAPTPINARGDVQGTPHPLFSLPPPLTRETPTRIGYQGRQGGGGTIDPPSPPAAAAASPSTFATCSAREGGARRPVRAPLRGTEGVSRPRSRDRFRANGRARQGRRRQARALPSCAPSPGLRRGVTRKRGVVREWETACPPPCPGVNPRPPPPPHRRLRLRVRTACKRGGGGVGIRTPALHLHLYPAPPLLCAQAGGRKVNPFPGLATCPFSWATCTATPMCIPPFPPVCHPSLSLCMRAGA
jgi:hypothetical protein